MDLDFSHGQDSENDNRQPLKCRFPREIGRSQAPRRQQDSNKFIGLNYQDWLRNLKIILASEKLLYTLEKTPPKEAPADASPEELAKLDKWWDDKLKARCYVIVLVPVFGRKHQQPLFKRH
ncbi:hypothetical protein F511_23566 [Dorcoceras hygrometricum]|uniref:Uncharacterized protein n=1 Tax=Dorcoceras hygrometricum TaxID=472368 RepID=A0A2Z7AYZ3_9LAMI|nr:hypothetical protein F511_23566 [Dorcoceras hygrometricum]